MTTVEDSRKLTNPYVQTVTDTLVGSAMTSYGDSTRLLLSDILLELRQMNEYLLEIMENTG